MVALWDVGRPLGELRQHQEPVLCVAAWRAPGHGAAAGAGVEAAAAEVTRRGGEAADNKEAGEPCVVSIRVRKLVILASASMVLVCRPGGTRTPV